MTGYIGTCPICAETGGPLVECLTCGRKKHPVGRDAAPGADHCGCDCPGYQEVPHPGHLWPGEVHGESIGHADWHAEVSARPTNDKGAAR